MLIASAASRCRSADDAEVGHERGPAHLVGDVARPVWIAAMHQHTRPFGREASGDGAADIPADAPVTSAT